MNRMAKDAKEAKKKKKEDLEQEASASWFDEWKKWVSRIDLAGVVMDALEMWWRAVEEGGAAEGARAAPRGCTARYYANVYLVEPGLRRHQVKKVYILSLGKGIDVE